MASKYDEGVVLARLSPISHLPIGRAYVMQRGYHVHGIRANRSLVSLDPLSYRSSFDFFYFRISSSILCSCVPTRL